MNLAVHGLEGDIREATRTTTTNTTAPATSISSSPIRRSTSTRWTKTGSKTPSARTAAIHSACRAPTTGIIYGFSFSIRRLTKKAAPASSWLTPPPTPAPPSKRLRKQLIEAHAVDAMVAVGPNVFYTVTLPCTLWFLDKGKQGTPRADNVLFIDARHIYRQIDRAHRDWTEAQIGFLANIVRLYRDENPDFTLGGEEAKAKLIEVFAAKTGTKYHDVPGLCKVATLKEIEAQGWSLNPGRYVGVAPGEAVSDETSRNNSKS